MSETRSKAEEDPKDSNSSEIANFGNWFHRLSESNFSSDCEFIFSSNNVVIKGHKIIFAAASEVFQAMFYSDLKEDQAIKIEDLDPEGFQGMKEFIYTGKITFISVIHALQTYNAARKYLVSLLSKECIKYIKENIKASEVLEFFDYCKTTRVSEFDEICYKIIQEKTDEMVESEYFVAADIETIELILESPSLNLTSELDVFVHFERWALAEAQRKGISLENVASSFNDLKKNIRFLTMSAEEFLCTVEKSSLLTLEEKHAIALNLIRTDSKVLPGNLSMCQQRRNFAPLKSDNYPNKFNFLVSISEESLIIHDCILPSTDIFGLSLRVILKKIENQSIYFVIKPSITTGNLHMLYDRLLLMRTKLTVKSTFNNDNPLSIENEFKIMVSMANKVDQPGVVFAEIPVEKLSPFKDWCNRVAIEGSYYVERIL